MYSQDFIWAVFLCSIPPCRSALRLIGLELRYPHCRHCSYQPSVSRSRYRSPPQRGHFLKFHLTILSSFYDVFTWTELQLTASLFAEGRESKILSRKKYAVQITVSAPFILTPYTVIAFFTAVRAGGKNELIPSFSSLLVNSGNRSFRSLHLRIPLQYGYFVREQLSASPLTSPSLYIDNLKVSPLTSLR